ncbi:MAG: hypothetical protein IJI61_08590 [Oscillospiraceae bacterium]|nr:hypothetical protein [Oscillospiraceae bacterium]
MSGDRDCTSEPAGACACRMLRTAWIETMLRQAGAKAASGDPEGWEKAGNSDNSFDNFDNRFDN